MSNSRTDHHNIYMCQPDKPPSQVQLPSLLPSMVLVSRRSCSTCCFHLLRRSFISLDRLAVSSPPHHHTASILPLTSPPRSNSTAETRTLGLSQPHSIQLMQPAIGRVLINVDISADSMHMLGQRSDPTPQIFADHGPPQHNPNPPPPPHKTAMSFPTRR